MAGAAGERADSDAPGEFLAEFLSAIMRRQYAEALKYCRLILQYEPHNATARGFFPLLQHKLRAHEAAAAADGAGCAAGGVACGSCGGSPRRTRISQTRANAAAEAAEREGSASSRSGSPGSAGSCGSQSSLELDSSSAPAHSSPSLSFGRRTDQTDSASGASGVSASSGELGVWSGLEGSSASGLSAERWDSTNEAATEPDTDDNGNPPSTPRAPRPIAAGAANTEDVQNDNATAAPEPLRTPHLKKIFCQKLGLRR